MQSYEGSMDDIERQYPSLVLPSRLYEKYEQLRNNYNILLERSDAVIDKMNLLIEDLQWACSV